MKILREAGPSVVDLRALFSDTPQKDNKAANNKTTTGTKKPIQEPTDKNTWKYEAALKELKFSDDIISKLKALGEPFEKILEVYGTQIHDTPTKGDNPILAFFKQPYVQDNLLGKDLDASRFRALYNALAKKQVAHSEFWSVDGNGNDYNIIYCQDLYKKSPSEMSEYLELQKSILSPSADNWPADKLLENRKIFFTSTKFENSLNLGDDQNVARRAKIVMKYEGTDTPYAYASDTKLNSIEFAKAASGKISETTASVSDSGQNKLVDVLNKLGGGAGTSATLVYKYAAVLSLTFTSDSEDAKEALKNKVFNGITKDKIEAASSVLGEKKIMPRGRLNKVDADTLVLKIMKSIDGYSSKNAAAESETTADNKVA